MQRHCIVLGFIGVFMFLFSQVETAADDTAMQAALEALQDTISLAGCVPLTRRGDKRMLVQAICRFFLIDRVAIAIEQYVSHCTSQYNI